MKKYFNTEEKAQKHLEYRKTCAIARIEKSDDDILGDASFVYKDEKGKWLVFLQIVSKQMMKELTKNLKEGFSLIPFSEEEKIIKKEKKIKKIERKYKTLDIEDYTINKDL
jgi:hypothetical protein